MIFEELKKDLDFYNRTKKKKKFENIWEQRRKDFNNLVSDKNNNINKNFFLNFRSHKKKFISENPSVKLSNPLIRLIYSHQIKYNRYMYRKMINVNRDLKKILNSLKLDNIGNPGYHFIDGQKINERFLRHCHFFSLFKKKIPINKVKYITDIGGGYGSFARMIHKKYNKIKIIIVDLPEQLFLAKYYLSSNFPNSRVSCLQDIYKINKIDKKFLDNFEIILVPNTEYKKIKIDFNKNLIINFNSLGEMDKKTFYEYFESEIFTKSKYLFSVNRIDSFPTYNNNITFFDYKFDKFKKIYSKISPIWDIYFVKVFFLFTKKKFYTSRILEFIGSK